MGLMDPWYSSMILNQEIFTWVIYQSVTIPCHPSMVNTVNPEALYFLVVQSNQSFLNKKGTNPRINISID